MLCAKDSFDQKWFLSYFSLGKFAEVFFLPSRLNVANISRVPGKKRGINAKNEDLGSLHRLFLRIQHVAF